MGDPPPPPTKLFERSTSAIVSQNCLLSRFKVTHQHRHKEQIALCTTLLPTSQLFLRRICIFSDANKELLVF